MTTRLAGGSIRDWVIRSLIVALGVSVFVLSGGSQAPAEEDTLIEEVLTRYTLVDGEDYIEVEIEATITNNKRRSGRYIYYFDQYWFAIPSGATDIVVVSEGKELPMAMEEISPDAELFEEEEVGSVLIATVDFPKKLWYQKTRTITMSYRIPGSEPRTATLSRINPAYVMFPAWAWGDPGMGSVEIVVGPGWDIDVFGGDMQLFFENDVWVYRSVAIEDPYEWYGLIHAHNEDGFATAEMDLVGIDVELRWWPGDEEWSGDITAWMTDGFPLLQDLMGIPVDEARDALDIVEAAEPEYAGYAGWYDEDQDLIELGEHADPLVLLHEMAHLWSNDSLFQERWITEGLADQAAWEVLIELGIEGETEFEFPEEPETRNPWAFPLNEWRTPQESPLLVESVARSETYGYESSWWVVSSLFDEIGVEAMTEVIVAADAQAIAYKGSGERETMAIPRDWRMLLDLLEEVGGSNSVQQTLVDFVLLDDEIPRLESRNDARAAYVALLEADGEWETPLAIRKAMGRWSFQDATGWIDEAHDVLDLWEEVQAAAEVMGLAPPNNMQEPYEAMTTDFDAAMAEGQGHLETMGVLADARAVVEAERDFYVEIGLRGKDPEAHMRASNMAYEADLFDEAVSQTEHALALMEDAPRLGKERVKWTAIAAGGAALLVLILLTLLIIWIVRRVKRKRRARRSEADVADGAPAEDSGTEPSGDPETRV